MVVVVLLAAAFVAWDRAGQPDDLTEITQGIELPDASGLPDLPGTDDAEAGSALAAVGQLEVKGRAPRTGYERDEFGPAWADVDHNGCDTRNDVLRRDLVDTTAKPDTRGCVVATGTLDDPYSGDTIRFERGQSTSSMVQIDHVVALADAWQKGAQQWDEDLRAAFANDPLNLLAVDGPTNSAKGAGDTATWLPPDTGYRCEYVARQVGVKLEYELWVTRAEADAMEKVLGSCPDEPLPLADPVPEPVG
ncbi:HNH endonuclease family protein [Cellulosimicrobium arenosum]|uniref:HNH endonuclease family protein n=1 Tax=Cellulosimicrobium arenosum TaxID=2708133 RepID=UPI0030CA4E0C